LSPAGEAEVPAGLGKLSLVLQMLKFSLDITFFWELCLVSPVMPVAGPGKKLFIR